MRWVIKLAVFFCCFFITARFCKAETGKFTMLRITSHLTPNPAWNVPPTTLDPSILNQPYSYLSKGVQSFVFASQDGQYVIKFFRHDHLSVPFWARWLPGSEGRQAEKNSKLQREFLSYKLAYETLQKETGLVYLHLNKTQNLHPTIDLIDKLGIHHPLNLDNYEFLIQKRACLLYTALEQMIEENRLDDAKTTLSKLVQLLAFRAQKGLSDKDPNLHTNFGVIGTDPIQIDVGRFREGPKRLDKNEIIRITDQLHKHLMMKSPELDQHLKNQIENL